MLRTKIHIKTLNNKFIDLDSRINFYDLDLKRVSFYVYHTEKQRITTIKKTTELKKLELIQLKRNLNLKKKSYIDYLRSIYADIIKENPLKLYNDSFKFSSYNSVLNKLIDLKIIKKTDTLGFYIVLNFYLKIKDTQIFNKLISINADIKHIELLIKSFDDYYKNLLNYRFKVNPYDLKQLDKNIITQNIREMFYFYLIKLKKSNAKSPIYRQNLKDKLFLNIVTEKDIKNLLEHNFKNNFKKILKEMPILSVSLQNRILNKYL